MAHSRYPSSRGAAGPTGQPPRRLARGGRARRALVVFGPLLLLVAACSTESRYRAYCFFIDGVPLRSTRPPVEAPVTPPTDQPEARRWTPSVHKPYADVQCTACHTITVTGGALQRGEDFVSRRPEEGLCAQCHKRVPGDPRFAHAPVLHQACLWCHQAHESPYPHLLRAAPAEICFRCHADEELSSGEHHPRPLTGSARSCIDCHTAHGGTRRFFLKAENSPNPPPAAGVSAASPGTQGPRPGQPDSAPAAAAGRAGQSL